MVSFLSYLRPWQKLSVVFLYDFSVAIVALAVSFSLRYGEVFPSVYLNKTLQYSFYMTIAVQSLTFYFNGLYKGMWRYTSTPDLVRIINAVTVSIVLSVALIFTYNRGGDFPRTIFIIDWFLLVFGLSAGRMLYRSFVEHTSGFKNSGEVGKAVILGAGARGESLLREIRRNAMLNLRIIGFLDDDTSKRNKTLHGINILGDLNSLEAVIKQKGVTQVFMALSDLPTERLKKIVAIATHNKVIVKKLPKIEDILMGKLQITQLKTIDPEDLLGRESVRLDEKDVNEFITDKTILVTGAGGSIGSELCRQLCLKRPKKLIAYEMTELFLYELREKLLKEFPELDLVFLIGDVRNRKQVLSVFKKYRPQSVFHAAAYKHVPLMEDNPTQSVYTNVYGTRIIASCATEVNVEKMILISSDKAVNPANVMGTTKRIAEMICKDEQKKSTTKFITVRFGNVLGSSGSVIPKFRDQINSGGPLTVTHPEIERYFMSIPEATQLVIKAGALGDGGEIFVLEMGEPVRIVALAEQLIKLHGLEVGRDIKIEFTGLRPGEKLYEELFSKTETLQPTKHEKIRIAESRNISENFSRDIDTLLDGIFERPENSDIITDLEKIVPEFKKSHQHST